MLQQAYLEISPHGGFGESETIIKFEVADELVFIACLPCRGALVLMCATLDLSIHTKPSVNMS
jgi:hypothetical protein